MDPETSGMTAPAPRTTRRRLAAVAKRVAAVVVVQLVVVFAGCADRLMLFPTRDPIAAGDDLERREVATADGALEIWIAHSQPGRPPDSYVLAFDGNGGRAEHCARDVAALFADRSVEIWAMNYPGFGGSSGGAELRSMAPSGLVAHDALVRTAGDAPVVVFGNSIGGTVALHVASQRPVAGVVLRSPPPLRRVILQRQGWWNLWLLAVPVALSVPGDLDAVDSASNVHAPCVFITGTADDIVPPSYQDHVFDAYAGPKRRVFTAGGHNDGLTRATIDEVRAATADFVK